MPATLTEIREAIAGALDGLDGWQVSPYMLANPSPPTVQVMPGEIAYDLTMHRALDDVTVIVQAFVPFASDIGGQQLLDELLDNGPSSVKALLEADRTLGGVVETLRVTNASGYQAAVAEGRPPVLLCEWTVSVVAKGT